MTVSCRLINSLIVAINKTCSYKVYKVPMGGNTFSNEVKIRDMQSRPLEYIFLNMLCTNRCHKIKVCGEVRIFNIAVPYRGI